MRRNILLIAALLFVLTPCAALALSVDDVVATLNGESLLVNSVCISDTSGLSCHGQNLVAPDGTWSVSQVELVFALHPFDLAEVGAQFEIRNDSASVQTFVFSQSLPFSPFSWMDFESTWTIGATLVDLNGDGATLSDVGLPIFEGLVDGSPAKTQFPSPQTFTAAPNGSVAFGTSGGFDPTGQPFFSIGQDVRFSLSPGDLVAFDFQPGGPFATGAHFGVIGLPEPATLSLLAVGLVGMSALHQRVR